MTKAVDKIIGEGFVPPDFVQSVIEWLSGYGLTFEQKQEDIYLVTDASGQRALADFNDIESMHDSLAEIGTLFNITVDYDQSGRLKMNHNQR